MDGANERSSTDERGFYMLVFGKLSLLRGACFRDKNFYKVHIKFMINCLFFPLNLSKKGMCKKIIKISPMSTSYIYKHNNALAVFSS